MTITAIKNHWWITCFFTFVGLLLTLEFAYSATETHGRDIAPTFFKVNLDVQGQKSFSANLKDTNGNPVFLIEIEPTQDARGNAVYWELALRRITTKGVDEQNLLAPVKNWHGIQRFHLSRLTLDWPVEEGYGKLRHFDAGTLTLLVLVESFTLGSTHNSLRTLSLSLYILPR